MRRAVIRIIAIVVILAGAAYGYLVLTSPKPGDVPPVPTQSSSTAPTDGTQQTPDGATSATPSASTSNEATAVPPQRDTLNIELGGSTSGTIRIELFNDIAPHHAERLVALARAGKYDNVVFHRVIDGFMAQTGDVEFGKHGENIAKAGFGGSQLPDLNAEFSEREFVAGVVGMARSNDPNSANSQFFIMFDAAPYLNGQYTIVGRVIAGMDVVNAIKKGVAAQNGAVSDPDFMKTVTVQ